MIQPSIATNHLNEIHCLINNQEKIIFMKLRQINMFLKKITKNKNTIISVER